MNTDDALKYLISWLRNPDQEKISLSHYGYDVYVPNVIREYLRSEEKLDGVGEDRRLEELSPLFLDAAWELCRRGILRPGVHTYLAQPTADGSAGSGYSITPFGHTWISESDRDDFVPTEPERFGSLLEPFKIRFGLGFHERAQEAIRCYGAHANLACCAMCGAAAESIILAMAIKKENDEEKVLRIYASAQGRSRIKNLLLGQVRKPIQKGFEAFLGLLSYWRDEASHGRPSDINDNEAFTSIALLLRFAQYSNEHWNEIVRSVK